jgi:RNA polymerase sigma-B factor
MFTGTRENLKLDTLRLFQDYQRSQNLEIRNRIMELNLGLVKKEAHYWVNQCNESYEDFIQVGCLGLLRAIERFDLEKGHAFSSFATPYIRGEIQHYLRDKGYSLRIPRRWLELGQEAMVFRREYQTKFNRQPTDSEIARELGISLKQWCEIKLAFQNREPISLDLPINQEEEGETSLGETVADPKYRSFQLSQDDRIRVQQALSEVEEKTREILEFVFLRDLTRKETAEQLGISVITVSRRLKKGLDFLKKTMTREIF